MPLGPKADPRLVHLTRTEIATPSRLRTPASSGQTSSRPADAEYLRHKASQFRWLAMNYGAKLSSRFLDIAAALEAKADQAGQRSDPGAMESIDGSLGGEAAREDHAITAGEGGMKWYRLYLYSGLRSFQGRHEFEAAGDREAMMVAELLCEACSDLCETFELWEGVRRVDTSFSRLPRPSVSAEQVNLVAQNSLIRSEQAMRDSHWAVARSKRLIERMEHLLARRTAP